jgi:hypothetical protein
MGKIKMIISHIYDIHCYFIIIVATILLLLSYISCRPDVM